MRTLILMLFFITTTACAQTVTLLASGCNANRSCSNVINDAALDIDVIAPLQRVPAIYINGVQYIGTVTMDNQSQYLDQEMINVNDESDSIWAQITFYHWVTRTTSGRVTGAYIQHYKLTGGTIAR